MQRVIDQGDLRPMAGRSEAMDDLRRILAAPLGTLCARGRCLRHQRQDVEAGLSRIARAGDGERRIGYGGWLLGVNFDLNDLQAFRAVVELGSFRKAAEAVNISQPALSRASTKLEAALGVRLFERTTRSVTLTTVGRVFAPSAEQLLDDLDVALLGIRDVSTQPPRSRDHRLRAVGCVLFPAERGRQPITPAIRASACKLLDSSANEVLGAVISGEADFGVQLHGQPGARGGVQGSAAGKVRGRMPARSSARPQEARVLERAL